MLTFESMMLAARIQFGLSGRRRRLASALDGELPKRILKYKVVRNPRTGRFCLKVLK